MTSLEDVRHDTLLIIVTGLFILFATGLVRAGIEPPPIIIPT